MKPPMNIDERRLSELIIQKISAQPPSHSAISANGAADERIADREKRIKERHIYQWNKFVTYGTKYNQ